MSGWFQRNRHLYPADWDAIARRVKELAGWRCLACDAPHGPPPHVLTVDHLNHDRADCSDENLISLCQRCHLRRQGLKPRPVTREDAIARLRKRAEEERTQMEMFR